MPEIRINGHTWCRKTSKKVNKNTPLAILRYLKNLPPLEAWRQTLRYEKYRPRPFLNLTKTAFFDTMLPIEPVEHYKDMRKELQFIMYQQQLHSKNKSVRWDILNVKFSFSWT